jgi:ABC-type antimicrobial peptide transport system permease subunit
MLHDIRYAMRGLARSPGFALSVIMIIGLALGLNTTMFTVFNAYVLRPFAVRDPYSLYQPVWIMKDGGRLLTQPEFDHSRRENTLFSDAIETENLIANTAGVPLLGRSASSNYFTMLGVAMAAGRPLAEGDSGVVVLSDVGWKAKFAGDPDILGKTIVILGQSYTVIGVTRPEFAGISQASPEFWIPIDPAHAPSGLSVTLRLKPGVSAKQAEAVLSVWAIHTSEDGPADERPRGMQLLSNATQFPLTGATLTLFSSVLVNTYEPLAYAGGIVCVLTSALAASYVPSLRATRIDPASTLRGD